MQAKRYQVTPQVVLARTGFFIAGAAALGAAALGRSTATGPEMWMLYPVTAIAALLASGYLNRGRSGWQSRVAGSVALGASVLQAGAYTAAGGHDVAGALSTVLLLVGAWAAATRIPTGAIVPESLSIIPLRWALLTRLLTGVMAIMILLSSRAQDGVSPWWGIPLATLLWFVLVSRAMVRPRSTELRGLALCGALQLPAIGAWFYPADVVLPQLRLLGLAVIAACVVMTLACWRLSSRIRPQGGTDDSAAQGRPGVLWCRTAPHRMDGIR